MGFLRTILLLVVALTTAVSAAPPGEKKKKRKFNIDLHAGWGGYYRPLRWTPIDLTIVSGLKEHFGGAVRVTVQQDELTRMRIVQEIVLTPDMPLRVPLVSKVAFAASRLRVDLHDAKGRLRAWKDFALWSGRGSTAGLKPIREEDILIGVAGPAGFGLMDLPRRALCRTDSGTGDVRIGYRPVRMLPWDWTGYDSLDLLVLYDLKWDQLRQGQARAIVRWVSNGGVVLMVLGSRQFGRKHPIASLVPFEPGPVRQVRAAAWWRQGASGPRATVWSVPCWSIPTKLPRGWRVLWSAGAPPARWGDVEAKAGPVPNAPVYAYGPVGFGRVGVLALEPARLAITDEAQRARFWALHIGKLLNERRIVYSDNAKSDELYNYGVGLAGNAANAVLEHLYDIPELRPLSIWVVIALLVALAVLLGPVDYLVLRLLGRLPLTWVTSAIWVLLFTVGAYYGVQALRSGEVQVRAVSVVDAIERGPAWRTTYCGIFAPYSADYCLTDPAGTPLAATHLPQWWSSVVPTETGMNIYTYSADQATRTVTCVQGRGGSLPSSVPINIWSMQCFIAEGPAKKFPFRARVVHDGQRVAVEVVNTSERPIRSGCVQMSGGRRFGFGQVPAGSRRRFSGRWRSAAQSGARISSTGGPWPEPNLPGKQATLAWGTLRRSRGMDVYLEDGAVVVACLYEDPALGFGLKGRKVVANHIQLARLVVNPRRGPLP